MGTFEPECLTIGLGNGCNLACKYCYGKADTGGGPPRDDRRLLSAVGSAADLVARACVRRGRRLAFGFQGVGEPLLDLRLLVQADHAVRAIASRHGLAIFSFITSNGTMPEQSTRWAAERFDRFCLSLDGPAHLHDRSRLDHQGRPTFAKVQATLAMLKDMGKAPACRVTVTCENVLGMAEMAEFLFGEMGLSEVQFEPVFRQPHLQPSADLFVQGLLAARAIARRSGSVALYTGYRPGEVHGPFCQPLRHVLFVTPGGLASACLFRESEPPGSRFIVGDSGDQGFAIDQSRIDAFCAAVVRLPEACTSCAVQDHCSRGCPDFCPLAGHSSGQNVADSLGCRINRLLHAAEGNGLPDVVLDAQKELQLQLRCNVDDHIASWRHFLANLKAQVPMAEVADDGVTVRLGKLSPGCVHCKQGRWNCIFVTRRCNLACAFCCSPKASRGAGATSALGEGIEEIIARALSLDIRGLSLSGGEPFLEPERTLSMLGTLRRQLPDRYLWLYTNGVLLRSDLIDRLAAQGLDEIRFNAAATGYTDPIVLATMAAASRRIPAVTVEIPAIPTDAAQLVAALSSWAEAGVAYLNLHELMREPDSISARLTGEFTETRLADGHTTDVASGSRNVVLQVMAVVAERKIPLQVNFCSFSNKLHQLRGRRRTLARLARQPHERIVDGEYLETVVACRSRNDFQLVNPEQAAALRVDGQRLFLIRRLAPLSVRETGPVVRVTELE